MNILIFDPARALSTLLRSTLLTAGFPVSVSTDARDTLLKLDTALFDAVVLVPEGGVPREVADFLDAEMEHLPILLAGVHGATPASPRIHAVFPSPVDLAQLTAVLRRLEAGVRERGWNLPVVCSFGDGAVACRASRVTRHGMVVMPAGSLDEFHRLFSSAGGRNLRAIFECGERIELPGAVGYIDGGGEEPARAAGIIFETEETPEWTKLSSLVPKSS